MAGSGGFGGGGGAERIGDKRRSRTAIIIQDYAACCFRPAPPARISSTFIFFIIFKEPCSSTSLPLAQHSACYTLVASGEGRSGRGINLGLPHSVLGFQHRRHPLKVSGARAPAARWGEFYNRSERISVHLLVLITVEPTNPSDE